MMTGSAIVDPCKMSDNEQLSDIIEPGRLRRFSLLQDPKAPAYEGRRPLEANNGRPFRSGSTAILTAVVDGNA